MNDDFKTKEILKQKKNVEEPLNKIRHTSNSQEIKKLNVKKIIKIIIIKIMNFEKLKLIFLKAKCLK